MAVLATTVHVALPELKIIPRLREIHFAPTISAIQDTAEVGGGRMHLCIDSFYFIYYDSLMFYSYDFK